MQACGAGITQSLIMITWRLHLNVGESWIDRGLQRHMQQQLISSTPILK
jgi:hypothetical protein